MYNQDSFFTLTTLGQIGLLSLSVLMFVSLIASMARFCADWWVKLVVALGGFFLFVWLSPQIYYTYYLFIFEGLPIQSVVGKPPTIFDIFRLMTFSNQNNLSAHGQGLLAWSMIIAGQLSQFSRKCRNAAN